MSPRRSPGEGTLFYSEYAGLWIAGYTIDEKQYRVTAKKRNDALAKRRELKKQIDAGIVAGTGRVKVGAYMDDWLEKVHKKRAKPKTFRTDTAVVNRHIKPHIGGKRLGRLKAREIDDMITAIQAGGDGRQGSTRSALEAYKLLRRALDDAVKRRLIPHNAAAAVDKPKHTYTRHKAFTPGESLRIIATAEASCDETWAARWKAGFMTGLREGELLGLEWDRVDFDNDLLHVTHQLQELQKVHGCGEPTGGKYPCGKVRVSFCPQARWDFPPGFAYRECERSLVWTPLKTESSTRPLPIIPPLRDVLVSLTYMDGPNPHNLVFRHRDGKPFSQSQDQKAWRQLLVEAGVPHVGQHTLRRTTATLLRAAQVDEQTRKELFGWASTDVARLYAGAELDHYRAAMGKLAEQLAPHDLDED